MRLSARSSAVAPCQSTALYAVQRTHHRDRQPMLRTRTMAGASPLNVPASLVTEYSVSRSAASLPVTVNMALGRMPDRCSTIATSPQEHHCDLCTRGTWRAPRRPALVVEGIQAADARDEGAIDERRTKDAGVVLHELAFVLDSIGPRRHVRPLLRQKLRADPRALLSRDHHRSQSAPPSLQY